MADGAQAHGAAVLYRGALGTRPGAIDPLVRKRPSTAPHLRFVDDAGPGGAWLDRSLTTPGDDGWVVAPALIPTKAGDRVTTDRRAAVPRARLARAGDLTAVSVPTVDEAARRDLTWAREDVSRDLQDAKVRLQALVRRPASREVGRAHGGPAHRRWLSAVGGPTPAPHSVVHADVRAVPEPTERRQRLAQARHDHGHAWHCDYVVEARHAWRGVPCTVAVIMGAAMGDRTRVDHPRARRQGVGRMPAASASGAQRRPGALTNAGHTQARRARVEGAWADRDPAQVSRPLQRRLAPPPQIIQDLSWTAQGRLCQRYRRLVSRGPHATVVTVALARERAGFLGAMARAVPGTR